MLKVIKRFVKVVRMSLCHHKFVLMDTEFNKVSLRIGCGHLWYRCPKCGKMVHTEITWKGSDTYAKGVFSGIKKRN